MKGHTRFQYDGNGAFIEAAVVEPKRRPKWVPICDNIRLMLGHKGQRRHSVDVWITADEAMAIASVLATAAWHGMKKPPRYGGRTK